MFSASKTAGPSGYNINNSLRFRSSASASLTRTPAGAGNQKTWTWSGWVKRGTLSATQGIFSANTNDNNKFFAQFNSNNTFEVLANSGGGTVVLQLTTSAVYRDPSAWYHIVVALDTTQATTADRCKIYVNGSQVTAFGTATYPSQNTDINYNQVATTSIGSQLQQSGGTSLFDGYMAEINFVNAQALTPSSFGSTNATTGVWQPKKYTGSYGTNGFYLPFSDIATTSGSNAGLGKDFSGNTNYWNTNNISVTAGTTYDAMTDSPTLTSSTVANYAVMNPLSSASGTLTNGNLTFSNAGAVKGAMGTFGLESGKWYWENTITTLGANDLGVGILFNNATAGMRDGTVTSTFSVFYQANTNVRKNGTIVANYASYTTGDIIGIAYDADTRSITFYKNNTLQGSITADAPTSPYVVWIIQPNTITATVNANFGQQPFSYTPPTGFNRLNTFNLPNSTVVKGNSVMDATLYSGNDTTNVIVNQAQFKPDLVWIKARNAISYHGLIDSVRGRASVLFSNATDSQGTSTSIQDLVSFNSNGFTLGDDAQFNCNTSGSNLVAWQWQAGQGSTSSNTSGSITSTVSVNTTAGFSVVTYTGNGTTGASIGHGLGVAPRFIITKSRSNALSWLVYHASAGASTPLVLNSTAAATAADYFNSQTPTSSVFYIGSSAGGSNITSATYVAYCWAAISGFSAFGSYTGNGSADGTFVYLGFRPKWIIIRPTNVISSWTIEDTARSTYNVMDARLFSESTDAEVSNGNGLVDYLSNGFKPRVNHVGINGSGNTYIYAAFAENPFKNALAR